MIPIWSRSINWCKDAAPKRKVLSYHRISSSSTTWFHFVDRNNVYLLRHLQFTRYRSFLEFTGCGGSPQILLPPPGLILPGPFLVYPKNLWGQETDTKQHPAVRCNAKGSDIPGNLKHLLSWLSPTWHRRPLKPHNPRNLRSRRNQPDNEYPYHLWSRGLINGHWHLLQLHLLLLPLEVLLLFFHFEDSLGLSCSFPTSPMCSEATTWR